MIRESLLISKPDIEGISTPIEESTLVKLKCQLSYQQKAVEKRFNASTAFSPYYI